MIAQTWQNFAARRIATQSAYASQTGIDIKYYKEWNCVALTTAKLLDDLDGRCDAFANLLVDSLKAAGVKDTPFLLVRLWASNPKDGMLIKNWDFTGNGTANVTQDGFAYPYQNTLADPTTDPGDQMLYPEGLGCYFKKTDDVWDYYWGATHEVNAIAGLRGQNSDDPKSHFSDHRIVKISGKYYDPSYGTGPFNSMDDWEAASVGGFYTRQILPGNNYRLIIRKDLSGHSITTDEI